MGPLGTVVGRFRVGAVEDRGQQQVYDYEHNDSRMMPQVAVTLHAITPEHGEEFDARSFYRSTPQGKIEMVIQNPDAAEQFQTGDVFEVAFSRLPKP